MEHSALVRKFLESADSWVCDNYAVDIRYVAIRSRLGLRIIEAAVSLWPLPPEKELSFKISTPMLAAGQHQEFPVSKSRALEILLNAASGVIEIEDGSGTFNFFGSLDFDSEMKDPDRWHMPLHLTVFSPEESYPSREAVAGMDCELRLAELPFDGLPDLMGGLGFGYGRIDKKTPRIEITVSPPVDLIFEETTLRDDKLRVVLHAHPELNISQVGLTVRGFPGGGLNSRRHISSLINWCDPGDNRRVGTVNVTIENCDSILTMISLEKATVRRQMIVDPPRSRNQRFLAINRFDDSLVKLRWAIFEAQNSRDFERGVSVLLFLLGFSAAMPLETDSPDIVVSTPLGRIVLIECTTKLDDYSTKLGKLVGRRTALSDVLSASGMPGQIIAALVCRLPRNSVLLKEEALVESDVLYYCAEDIESALLKVRYLVNPDDLLNESISAMKNASRVVSRELAKETE